MSADTLLARLNKVKKVGHDRWTALCPSHPDKHPSLSIAELPDGRILLHDFAGCEVGDVVAAIGLDLADLFPPRPTEHFVKGERRPFMPTDVFEVLRMETGVIAVIAADMHAGRTVSDADYERLFVAVSRLDNVARASYGR